MVKKVRKYFERFLLKSAYKGNTPIKMLLPGESVDSIEDVGVDKWAVKFKKDPKVSQKIKKRLEMQKQKKLKKNQYFRNLQKAVKPQNKHTSKDLKENTLSDEMIGRRIESRVMDIKNKILKSENGVHESYTNEGSSEAGIKTNIAKERPTTHWKDGTEAKELHRKKLEEFKSLHKPNLPKKELTKSKNTKRQRQYGEQPPLPDSGWANSTDPNTLIARKQRGDWEGYLKLLRQKYQKVSPKVKSKIERIEKLIARLEAKRKSW